MRVLPVACLKDNYAYLVIAETGDAAIVDASEAAPVRAALAREGVTPRAIWSTHHHWDHVGANQELADELHLEVVGHVSDEGRLPALTRRVDSGDRVRVGEGIATCIHVPGHTLGALAYFVDTGPERAVFTGDTLFIAGCGRLFEGKPAQMLASLTRLSELAVDTRVYCGHEYTEQNLRFAAYLEPDNDAVNAARDAAATQRARGQPTVGTTIAHELAVNPFLRVRSARVRFRLGIADGADDIQAFGAMRAAKDSF
jgi:hydroxyacylglutathione hydrolase